MHETVKTDSGPIRVSVRGLDEDPDTVLVYLAFEYMGEAGVLTVTMSELAELYATARSLPVDWIERTRTTSRRLRRLERDVSDFATALETADMPEDITGA